MSGCRVEREKPFVWKNDQGWNCDQAGHCLRCGDVWLQNLADEVTWEEAIQAASKAVPSAPSLVPEVES